jgi:beta-lactamase class A
MRVQENRLALDQTVVVTGADAREPEPAHGASLGDEITLRQALTSMMSISSNASAYAVLRLLGRAEFNRALSDLGLHNTRVPLIDDAEDGDGRSVTTPHEISSFVRRLVEGSLLAPAGETEMRALLRLPEHLDAVVYSLPSDVEVSTKIGEVEDASNVVGWVETPTGPIILAIFSEDTDPGAARAVIGQIASIAYGLQPGQ